MSREEAILKLSKLTNRQLEVLRLVCEGLTYKKVGKQLFISENTVKTHMGNIYIELALDSLPTSERKLVLFQEFCPALQDMDIIPAVVEDQEEPEPVPESVMAMVVRDEKAIVPIPQAEIIDVPYKEIKNQGHPSRLRWMLFGLLLGIILSVLIGFAGWEAYQWVLFQLDNGETPTPVVVAEVPSDQPEEIATTETESPDQTEDSGTSKTEEVTVEDTEIVIPTTQVPDLPIPSEVILFEDNFDSGLSPYWQVATGSPVVVNGMLTADEETWLIVGDPSWTDLVIEFEADAARCWTSRDDYNAVGLHMVDLNNMIAFSWQDCESFWWSVQNGEWDEVPNTKASPGYEMLRFKVSVKGNQFSVYVGEQLLSSFFSDRYKQGKIGLRLDNKTLIDNFIVKEAEE